MLRKESNKQYFLGTDAIHAHGRMHERVFLWMPRRLYTQPLPNKHSKGYRGTPQTGMSVF